MNAAVAYEETVDEAACTLCASIKTMNEKGFVLYLSAYVLSDLKFLVHGLWWHLQANNE